MNKILIWLMKNLEKRFQDEYNKELMIRIEKKMKELMEKEPSLTHTEAFDRIAQLEDLILKMEKH